MSKKEKKEKKKPIRERKAFEKFCNGVDEAWGDIFPMMATEEAGELIQAISKAERHASDPSHLVNLIEEMGDMYICLEALRLHYGIEKVQIDARIAHKMKQVY